MGFSEAVLALQHPFRKIGMVDYLSIIHWSSIIDHELRTESPAAAAASMASSAQVEVKNSQELAPLI